MTHDTRMNRLRKLFSKQDSEARKIATHFGSHSREYQKAVKSLDRIASMIRREALESRTPGTKKYLARWKKNPAQSKSRERLYHLVLSRDHSVRATGYPDTHKHCMTIKSKQRNPNDWTVVESGYKKNPAPTYAKRAQKLVELGKKVDAEKKKVWAKIGPKVKRLTSSMYYSKKWLPWRKLNEKSVRISEMLMREAAKENKRRK